MAPPPFITVSGNVTDPKGIPYAGGTITPILTVADSPTLISDGKPYVPAIGPFGLDIAGNFSFQLMGNNSILPAGSTWSFRISSAQGTVPIAFGHSSVSFRVNNLTLNASQDITSAIAAVVQNLTYAGGGAGANPVNGPTSSTINDIAVFNNTTGTLLADSGVSIAPPGTLSIPTGGSIVVNVPGSINGISIVNTNNGVTGTIGPPPVASGSRGVAYSLAAAQNTPLPTASIPAMSYSTVVSITAAAAGVSGNDRITWSFVGSPVTAGFPVGLVILTWCGSNNVNFVIANVTAAPITPPAMMINWQVLR